MIEHQRSLFAMGVPAPRDHGQPGKVALGGGAWIAVVRGWLGGADALLDALVESVAWRRGRRPMYDRVVDDPRLSRRYGPGEALPDPVLSDAGARLGRWYGVTFAGVGLNYYRDGRDSVAFHADRELRDLDDTLVAVLTLGACRPFLLRPKLGGASRDLAPGSGDLIVMGGACQVHYEHAVPKIARSGPRVSVTWRAVRRRAAS